MYFWINYLLIYLLTKRVVISDDIVVVVIYWQDYIQGNRMYMKNKHLNFIIDFSTKYPQI